jgi:hypothetical protein
MPTSPGDPDGRRLARRRAAQLAEAARLIRAAEALLEDTGLDTAPCRDLANYLREREQAELMKAHGRLAPRRRFRHHSGQPLHERRAGNVLFIDESGVSHPEKQRSEAYFVLGAVALDEEDLQRYCDDADGLKRAFFGTTDMTLHEPEMRRFDGPYYFAGDVAKQREFDRAVNELITRTPFLAFGVAIDKMAFADQFVRTGIDPYLPTDVYALAVIMLMERYVDFLATSSGGRLGRVVFESQGPREDAEHQLEYARVLVHGTQWMPPSDFQHCLEAGVRFRPKVGSDPLELADMLARDLYDWVASGCESAPHRWHVFNPKIYWRDDRQMGKFGIKLFPDSHIRDKIEAHRLQAGSQPKN